MDKTQKEQNHLRRNQLRSRALPIEGTSRKEKDHISTRKKESSRAAENEIEKHLCVILFRILANSSPEPKRSLLKLAQNI